MRYLAACVFSSCSMTLYLTEETCTEEIRKAKRKRPCGGGKILPGRDDD